MLNNIEIVKIINNQPMTDSLKIAEVFGKRHSDVLNSIKSLKCSEEFTERNFSLSEYIDTTGKSNPMYNITKDGFVFLVMGYTGEKACQFKELYIKRFNEMEQQLKQLVPTNLKDALLLAYQQQCQIEEQQQLIEQQQPKVQFYDEVMKSKDFIDMSEVAKCLNKNIGRNKLFKILKEQGVLRFNNEPYQKYVDNGFFKIETNSYTKNNETRIYLKTVVSQAGVEFINKLIEK